MGCHEHTIWLTYERLRDRDETSRFLAEVSHQPTEAAQAFCPVDLLPSRQRSAGFELPQPARLARSPVNSKKLGVFWFKGQQMSQSPVCCALHSSCKKGTTMFQQINMKVSKCPATAIWPPNHDTKPERNSLSANKLRLPP